MNNSRNSYLLLAVNLAVKQMSHYHYWYYYTVTYRILCLAILELAKAKGRREYGYWYRVFINRPINFVRAVGA